MSAFGQSIENSLAHDWQRQIHAAAWAEAKRAREWLEERLRALKPGEVWCEHEPVRTGGELASLTFGRVYVGHVIPPGEVCSQTAARVQYGPAPGNWEEIVKQAPQKPEVVGHMCRCFPCCCKPGQGHKHPAWVAYEQAMRDFQQRLGW